MLLQLWLLQRHLQHVAAHRDRVPTDFAVQVELREHQKAADYTRAKGGLARFEIVFSVLLLLLWTLGGGLDLVNRFWLDLEIDPLVTGILLIFSVFFISGLLDLPFSLHRTFSIEAAYRFQSNHTPAIRQGPNSERVPGSHTGRPPYRGDTLVDGLRGQLLVVHRLAGLDDFYPDADLGLSKVDCTHLQSLHSAGG